MQQKLQIMFPTQQSLSFCRIKERPSRVPLPPRLINVLDPPTPVLLQ
jgi:hypothetical protein